MKADTHGRLIVLTQQLQEVAEKVQTKDTLDTIERLLSEASTIVKGLREHSIPD
jgi:uncharacterized membrane protein YccC